MYQCHYMSSPRSRVLAMAALQAEATSQCPLTEDHLPTGEGLDARTAQASLLGFFSSGG